MTVDHTKAILAQLGQPVYFFNPFLFATFMSLLLLSAKPITQKIPFVLPLQNQHSPSSYLPR